MMNSRNASREWLRRQSRAERIHAVRSLGIMLASFGFLFGLLLTVVAAISLGTLYFFF